MRFSILTVAALAAQLGFADSLYTFNGVSSLYAEQPSVSLGFTFTANSTFNVNELGWFDATGNGFQTPHTVGIFDTNKNLLASTTLAAGTGDPLIDSFRYQAITPITLQAGSTYMLAGITGGPLDAYTVNDFVTNFAVNPTFTVDCNAALYTYSPTLVYPETHYQDHDYRVYIGPNLEGDSVCTAPEPAALLLLSVGVLILFVARRARRSVVDAK
jgi:hypothetical protein